jgi:hypothetical protein
MDGWIQNIYRQGPQRGGGYNFGHFELLICYLKYQQSSSAYRLKYHINKC